MIDHQRIRSGFDVEVQLGAEFFRHAVISLFEAGELPSRVSSGMGTADIDPPTGFRFHFDSESESESEPWDVELDLPIRITSPVDLGFTCTLLLRIEPTHHQNPTTCLVDRVDLDLKYVGLSEKTLDVLRGSVLAGNTGALEAELRRVAERRLPAFLPGDLQRVAVRKLPGDGDVAPCFAVLANLQLKIGPTAELSQGRFRLLPPEPDDEPVDRGVPDDAVSFLPHGMDVALGAPPELYGRLSRDLLHQRTREDDDGALSRPLLSNGERVGRFRTITAFPDPGLLSEPRDVLTVRAELTLEDAVAGTFDVDVEQDVFVTPEIDEEGDLDLEVKVDDPEADTSLWEALAFGVFFFLFAGLPGLFGGLVLFGLASVPGAVFGGLSVAAVRAFRERREEESREQVEEQVGGSGDGLSSLLAVVPSRVTITRHRDDPFFHHHYQVRTRFTEARIRMSGLSFGGTVSTATEDRAIRSVSFVSREREDEPNGALRWLEYEVPNHREIRDLEAFRRLDPESYPNVFALSREDVVERIRAGRLGSVIVYPIRVRRSGSRIAELLFEDGGALQPAEAGELQMAQALWVARYNLVRPRRGRPYYRSDPDRRKKNNLAERPRFTAMRSVRLGRRFGALVDRFAGLGATDDAVWFWELSDSGEAEIPGLAHRLRWGLVRVVELMEEVAAGETPPDTPLDLIQIRSLDPEAGDFGPGDASALVPRPRDLLVDRIEALDDRDLDRTYSGPLADRALSNYRLGHRLIDLMAARYDALRDRIAVARREEREANPPPPPEPVEPRPPCPDPVV